MARGGLIVAGLAGLAVLAVAGIAAAREDDVNPTAPTPSTTTPKPTPKPGMTIAEKAFAVRNHPLYWSWVDLDKACRAMNAEEDPENTVATCGSAMAIWKEMMADVGVKTSEEEAVYNQLAGA